MKKTFKNSKGITLVALVITIIILLILAGISISAFLLPTPNTMFCLVLHSLHLLQFIIEFSSSSHVSNIITPLNISTSYLKFYRLFYITQFSTNFIFTSSSVFISAFVPIGTTVFLSICPKLFDFIIGNLYSPSKTSSIIFSRDIPLSCS